jgi:hypothetical protein
MKADKKGIVTLKNHKEAYETSSMIEAANAIVEFLMQNRSRQYSSVEIIGTYTEDQKEKQRVKTLDMFPEED